jgi:hypothetical protein
MECSRDDGIWGSNVRALLRWGMAIRCAIRLCKRRCLCKRLARSLALCRVPHFGGERVHASPSPLPSEIAMGAPHE